MKPQIETLESRDAPAVWIDPAGVVHAQADKGATALVAVTDADDIVVFSGKFAGRFKSSDVSAIVMIGNKADNTFTNDTGIQGIYLGLQGNDSFFCKAGDFVLDQSPGEIVLRMREALSFDPMVPFE